MLSKSGRELLGVQMCSTMIRKGYVMSGWVSGSPGRALVLHEGRRPRRRLLLLHGKEALQQAVARGQGLLRTPEM